MNAWVWRSGKGGGFDELAFGHNLIAVGWFQVQDLTDAEDLGSIRAKVEAAFPASDGKIGGIAMQLHSFRNIMAPNDLVLMLSNRTTTKIAIGTVTGPYAFRPGVPGPSPHVRPVTWSRRDVPRVDIGDDLLSGAVALFKLPPAAVARLTEVIATGADPAVRGPRAVAVMAGRVEPYELAFPDLALPDLADATDSAGLADGAGLTDSAGASDVADLDLAGGDAISVTSGEPDSPTAALEQFMRNIHHARGLARAGARLVNVDDVSLDVADTFRAAWVQACAALDHWVRQELRLRKANKIINSQLGPDGDEITFTLNEVLRMRAGQVALEQLVAERMKEEKQNAYVQPDAIRNAFVPSDRTGSFWTSVAGALEAASGDAFTADSIIERQRGIAQRRNEIVHYYDEDRASPTGKRPMTEDDVQSMIDWVEQLVLAIVNVLRAAPAGSAR